MADTTFKAVPYDQLPALDKAVLEANAKSEGLASGKEYYDKRGGVNKSGYYGDSYIEGVTLTDEEYAAAKAAGTLGKTGLSINAAAEKKAYDYYISQGFTPEQASAKAGFKPVKTAVTNNTPNNAGSTATGNVMENPFTPGTDAYKAWNERKSAYDILMGEFNRYGLGSLVAPLKDLIQTGVSPSEFTLRLRDTDAYRQRFVANQARINKGLKALSEAEYIGLEDQYQDVMRRYGLPKSYYEQKVDPITGIKTQPGFTEFISGDVSPVELEQRISTAYNRVINANPEVSIALKTFYPDITNGDILAYALNPDRALNDIQRKITAAEIGGAAVASGLTTNESDAEYLARYGITKEQAQQGYRTISGMLPRASQLSSIYQKQVEGGPYTQASAEREVFGTPGAAEEERKRKQITSLEQAAFSGQSGLTQGALGRERAGQF